MTVPLLEVAGLKVKLGGTPILHGCDLTVQAGELVALVGPNGAGKSTLARAAAGLVGAGAGDVRLGGQPLGAVRGRRRAQLRAYVPQRPAAPAGMRVREAVELGRSPHLGPLDRPGGGDREAVRRALSRTGMLEFAERRLQTLSGGELQRVALAVALAQEAPLLIADEPTASLDLGAAAAIARLLHTLARDEALGVLLVVHDLALAAAVSDRVVVMSGGRTVASGSADEVLDRARLAAVWEVNAELDRDPDGRLALHVDWMAA